MILHPVRFFHYRELHHKAFVSESRRELASMEVPTGRQWEEAEPRPKLGYRH